MGGAIRKLAGETVIYGMSTILARMINFFFVPIYTRILSQEGYGSYTEIMSYVAVLQVVLVFGLETGCFKFANDNNRIKKEGGDPRVFDPDKPFSTALITVICSSFLFFGAIVLAARPLSSLMGYDGYSRMMVYIGGILALDSVTAVLFARLRYQQKAVKFAVFKTIKILSELGFNLLLFFGVPAYLASHPDSLLLDFIPAETDFSYILFAVFLSCIVAVLLFVPELLRMKLDFNGRLWKRMMLYSVPLMIAGLPGIMNESLDRFLFRFFAPEGMDWRAQLGVYGAAAKLAVIMNLFIQMFRYAAEPFFFARYKETDANKLYAGIMEYFVAFCMLIFLGVILYMDVIGILLGKDFREALDTVPVLLFSYMLLGVLFNVSMWYKLSGHTKYAINITVLGLAVTAAVNIAFMPLFSYRASVWAHLLSCLAMLAYSVYLGNRYYPIPYRWKKIGKYVLAALLLYAAAGLIDSAVRFPLAVKLGVHTVLILIYVVYCLCETGLWKQWKEKMKLK